MKHLKPINEFINEKLNDEQKLEALQDLSVDVSALIKKHLPKLKKLDPKSAKEFNKLLTDFKTGIDDLSDY